MTLKKGIIRKGPLVKAMSEEKPQLDFSLSEFGIDIHRVAITKFIGKYENALKNKTVPELIIAKWEKSCKELSQKEATEYIKSFLGGLASDELVEMESPSEYKRGCGKKKEVFVRKQFEKSFQNFQKNNPYRKRSHHNQQYKKLSCIGLYPRSYIHGLRCAEARKCMVVWRYQVLAGNRCGLLFV